MERQVSDATDEYSLNEPRAFKIEHSLFVGVVDAPKEHPCGLRFALEFNVVVEQDPVNEKIGSIIVPEQAKEKQKHQTTRGTVVMLGSKAGSDIWTEDQGVKVGDRVVYAQYGGTFLDVEQKYRVLKDKDIIAVVA
jgi:co-chaperonin GroES (HSP10)